MPQLFPPKVIYSLWIQGADSAPDLIKMNFELWSNFNKDYSIKIMNLDDVNLLLDDLDIPIENLPPQALSDIVRARILHLNGGIWVDASVLPTKPLNEWLPTHITPSGFFAFERPGPDRPLSSWFLASTQGNLIMSKWWDQVYLYWKSERSPFEGNVDNPTEIVKNLTDKFPYFWFHYLFGYLLENDDCFKSNWQDCSKYSADIPHALQFYFAKNMQPDSEEIKNLVSSSPVHKLNWRSEYPVSLLKSLVGNK